MVLYTAKSLSIVGRCQRHSKGWRASAKLGGRTINGPTRLNERDADADLKEARTAQTREEYCHILRQLQARAAQMREESYGGPTRLRTARSENTDCGMIVSHLDPDVIRGSTRRKGGKAMQLVTSMKRSEAARCNQHSMSIRRSHGNRFMLCNMGTCRPHGNGWRAVAKLRRRTVVGPYRVSKRKAYMDLKQARTAQTREEYCNILSRLHAARSENIRHAQPEMTLQREKSREAQIQTQKGRGEEAADESTDECSLNRC